MKLNLTKTKVILFNPCKKIDFSPNIQIEKKEIESVDEIKVLGVIVSKDLKWSKNIQAIIQKTYKRLC